MQGRYMAGWLVAESVAKAENYMGGTPHIKTYTGRGDNVHTHKVPLAYNVSFWTQKLINDVSFWIQKRN